MRGIIVLAGLVFCTGVALIWYYFFGESGSGPAGAVTAAQPTLVRQLEGRTGYTVGLAFTPDGSRLLSANMDGTVGVWDLGSGAELFTFGAFGKKLTAFALSPDGTVAAVGRGDGRLELWDPATGAIIHFFLPDPLDIEVTAVAFRPDGQQLAWTTRRLLDDTKDQTKQVGEVKLVPWPFKDGTPIESHLAHNHPVWGVAYSPDGHQLATAGGLSRSGKESEGTLKTWNLTPWKETRSWQGHTDVASAVAFSSDGKLLASAGWDGQGKLWDPSTATLVKTLKGHQDRINCLAFAPEGRWLLVTGSNDQTVRGWDVVGGGEIWSLPCPPSSVGAIAVSRDGQFLATGTERTYAEAGGPPKMVGLIRLWKLP